MNSTIKIFLASSAELKSDRKEFEIFITRENKIYNQQGFSQAEKIWTELVEMASEFLEFRNKLEWVQSELATL